MVLLIILSVFESYQSEDGKPNEMQFSYLMLWNALPTPRQPSFSWHIHFRNTVLLLAYSAIKKHQELG